MTSRKTRNFFVAAGNNALTLRLYKQAVIHYPLLLPNSPLQFLFYYLLVYGGFFFCFLSPCKRRLDDYATYYSYVYMRDDDGRTTMTTKTMAAAAAATALQLDFTFTYGRLI